MAEIFRPDFGKPKKEALKEIREDKKKTLPKVEVIVDKPKGEEPPLDTNEWEDTLDRLSGILSGEDSSLDAEERDGVLDRLSNMLGDAPELREHLDALREVRGDGEFGKALAAARPVRQVLNALRGPISQSSISKAQEIIKDYSLEDLTGVLTSSVETDWKRKPGFYRAVVDEISERSKKR